jgi:hypothetical protein
MRIEGVDDQLQQLIDFGLKFTFRHGIHYQQKQAQKRELRLPRMGVGLQNVITYD